jgi:hypothetical protein
VPTFSGNTVSPVVVPVAASFSLSDNLEGYLAEYNTEHLGSSQISGDVTDNLPVDFETDDKTGNFTRSVKDNYYYRIWIIPRTINLGRILSEQSVPIEVWNSFFESRDFGPIAVIGNDDGLTLTGDDSGTYNYLESRPYELTAADVGAQSYDVQYDWDFAGDGDTASFLHVLGQRLLAFALRHNWSSPVLEQLSFRTDVLSGISGREQRIKLRQTPRRRVEMTYLTLDAEEKAYLEQITQGQNEVFAIPLWHDVSTLQVQPKAGPGATNFQCDTSGRDYEIGGMAFLQNGDSYEILTIDTFDDTGFVTTEGAANEYPAGSRVCPARFGIIEDKFSLSRHTTHHEAVRIPWLLDPNSERSNQFTSYVPDTYLGIEIYDEQNDYSQEHEIEQTTVRELMDNEVGALRIMAGEAYPKRDYPFSKLIDRDEFGLFLQWFYNRSGKYEPFWWLDYTPAFHIREGLAFDSIFLTVKTNDYVSSAFGNEMRRDIAIDTSSGWIYRHIDDAADNGDGTTTLTLDTPPGVPITVDEDPLICFLRKVRLDTDMAEIIYETNEVIRTAVRFKDVI